MLNKKLQTLSKFLRKEKVSVIIGFSLGIALVLSYPNGKGLSNNIVTVQAIDTGVLPDGDVGTSLSKNVIPSHRFTIKTASEHIILDINKQIAQNKGYSFSRELAEDTQLNYISHIKKEKSSARKKELTKKQKRVTATFKTTGYCSCKVCCGKWSHEVTGDVSRTASGTIPKAGRTVAVDKSVIPLGSVVIIDGIEYIAEDTGSAVDGNVIDIYFDSHSEALNWGVRYKEVTYIIQ